mgnify:CR=1 FL=1
MFLSIVLELNEHMNRIIKNYVGLVVLFLMFCAAPAEAFHEQFRVRKDLTYAGQPEDIVYEVSGERWDQPVSWSFTVYSHDQVLYRHAVLNDDNRLHYEDAGCVENCTGLVDCRKAWFLHQAFPAMIVTVAVDDAQRRDTLMTTFHSQAPSFYMTQLGLNEDDAHRCVDRLSNFLDSREIVSFSLPQNPVQFGPLMLYDRFQKTFIPFYQP